MTTEVRQRNKSSERQVLKRKPLNKENAPSNKLTLQLRTPNSQRTGPVSSTRVSVAAMPGSAIWPKPDSEHVSSFLTSQRMTMRQAYGQRADAMRTSSRQAITKMVKKKDISDSGICFDSDDDSRQANKKDRTVFADFPQQKPVSMFLTCGDEERDDESPIPPIAERQGGLSINRSISRVGLSTRLVSSTATTRPFDCLKMLSRTFDKTQTLHEKAAILARQQQQQGDIVNSGDFSTFGAQAQRVHCASAKEEYVPRTTSMLGAASSDLYKP
jgi:hypothetical protein